MSKIKIGTKKKLAINIIFVTLIIVSGWEPIVGIANANPYLRDFAGDASPDANTQPPTISAVFPENRTIFTGKNITIGVKVNVGESSTASHRFISEICYMTDWLPNSSIYEYKPDASVYPSPTRTEIYSVINLQEVPEGKHNITVYAKEKGSYEKVDGMVIHYYNFQIDSSLSVSFTTDNNPPVVSFPFSDHKKYCEFDIPLEFITNESVSLLSYVLDGQKNVTISGNTTLTGLSYGEHNVTVFAVDLAGNVGSSETVTFKVAEPESFLASSIAVASGVSAIVIVAGVLIHYKRRKR